MKINEILRKYFDIKKINQFEIEKRTGMNQSKVSLMLNNKRKISAEELIKFAIVFDINLEEIKKEIIQSVNLK